MEAKEIAKYLDGIDYGDAIKIHYDDAVKAAGREGFVIVFGISDDLLEFHGAIEAEISAWEGVEVFLNSGGLVENQCCEDDCPYFQEKKREAVPLEAVWDRTPYAWTIETTIPHRTFEIYEDGEPFSRGIVFHFSDLSMAVARYRARAT